MIKMALSSQSFNLSHFHVERRIYTDDKGRFRPEKGMPLLARRYKFVEIIGKGQSSISVKAAVS